MSPVLTIRPERDQDHAAVRNVIERAFSGVPYARGDEADLVDALRYDNALSVSLIAELDNAIVGQVALSPARPSEGSERWFALGPLAVLPAHQRVGIGTQLVCAGLHAIIGLGACGCILVGNPAYYIRFGFVLSPARAPRGQPSEFFMVKVFGSHQPSGPISFHAIFDSAA